MVAGADFDQDRGSDKLRVQGIQYSEGAKVEYPGIKGESQFLFLSDIFGVHIRSLTVQPGKKQNESEWAAREKAICAAYNEKLIAYIGNSVPAAEGNLEGGYIKGAPTRR